MASAQVSILPACLPFDPKRQAGVETEHIALSSQSWVSTGLLSMRQKYLGREATFKIDGTILTKLPKTKIELLNLSKF